MWNFEPTKSIDFLRLRVPIIAVSAVFLVASGWSLWRNGLNWGVDFVGGTEVQIKFAEAPSIDDLRARLGAVNLADSTLQRYGTVEENEILVRTRHIEIEREGGAVDVATLVAEALHTEQEKAAASQGRLDLNLAGWKGLSGLWPAAAEDEDAAAAEERGKKIVQYRKEHGGLIRDYAELESLFSAEEMAVLRDKTFIGTFALQRVDRVGAKVGENLRQKATQATIWSLAALLAYMWFRFELRFGVGAILALAHDAIITLGALSWFGMTFDLTAVAAVLTLLGYSINDSIVILDRVRDNMNLRRRDNIYDLLNWSVTQMLVRTLLTIGFTFIAVVGLYLFAGESVRPFSFTLLIGMIAGTYSTYSVVLPVVYYWKKRQKKVE